MDGTSAAIDEPILRTIVAAIEKTYGIDSTQKIIEEHLATRNSFPFWRIDMLNTNLDLMLSDDENEVLIFPRRSWKCLYIINHRSHKTYSVISESVFKRVRKHGSTGKVPHYLLTFTRVENGHIKADYRQMTLADYGVVEYVDTFTDDQYSDDFSHITNDRMDLAQNYTHYLIVYKAERDVIRKCDLICCTADFEIASRISLLDLVVPDASRLTEPEMFEEPEENNVLSLVQLKRDIRANRDHEPDIGTPATAKESEEEITIS